MHIAVINTGGTISCVGSPLAPMTATGFAEACTRLLDPLFAQAFPDLRLTYVTDLAFPSRTGTLDSTNLQPSDWCLIADYILAHYTSYDGFVVLHGTDTLDFSGTALPLLLQVFDAEGRGEALLSKPVILTGSQVPMFHEADRSLVAFPDGKPATTFPGNAPGSPLQLKFNTDAWQNVCGALRAAQSGIPEVAVFFHGQLFRSSRVRKTNANQFDAFSSPNEPPLARFGITWEVDPRAIPPHPDARVSLEDPAALALARAQLAAIRREIGKPSVAMLPAFPAWYDADNGTALLANLIRAMTGEGIQGLVLLSYGAGNFPAGHPDDATKGAVYQALDAANRAGIILIDNTMVPQGTVANATYAAGSWLAAVGALSPADMTPMASLAKLTVLLAARGFRGWSLDDVKRLMTIPLVGEMRPAS